MQLSVWPIQEDRIQERIILHILKQHYDTHPANNKQGESIFAQDALAGQIYDLRLY